MMGNDRLAGGVKAEESRDDKRGGRQGFLATAVEQGRHCCVFSWPSQAVPWCEAREPQKRNVALRAPCQSDAVRGDLSLPRLIEHCLAWRKGEEQTFPLLVFQGRGGWRRRRVGGHWHRLAPCLSLSLCLSLFHEEKRRHCQSHTWWKEDGDSCCLGKWIVCGGIPCQELPRDIYPQLLPLSELCISPLHHEWHQTFLGYKPQQRILGSLLSVAKLSPLPSSSPFH